MYDIIEGIIDHAYTTGDSMQQYIIYACCVMIPIMFVTVVDVIRSIFRGFINHRK